MKQFDTPVDRRATSSMKWEKYGEQDVIPLWVADTDFRAPPAVIEALQQRITHGVFGYTNTPKALNDCVIERLAHRYQWQISADDIIWLPGLVCGLNLACRSVGEAGNTVLSPKPIYPPFITAPQLSGRQVVSVPMKQQQGRWLLDLEALEQSITENSRLLLFCNPQNPGGTVYRAEELQQLAEIILRHDLYVCSDEIHCDLILEPDVHHIPLASLNAEIAQRTITLMAPSKTFNIAGLGCSFAIIQNAALRRRFRQVRRGIVPDVNLLGYTAAQAAFEAGDEWNAKQLRYLRANRDYLVEEINRIPGLKVHANEATYLAWIDISGAKLENPPHFFEQAGVGLSPGRDFGDENFMRLNFGCPRETLEEAVKRIRCALLKKLPAG